MKNLSYAERDYVARLEGYIESEAYSAALYAALATRCGGSRAGMLRAMGEDERRHLKAMQMEYYLLTGDSRCPGKIRISADTQELLRSAYSGEGDAAEGYEREAQMHRDEALCKVYRDQGADERRHRANAKKILGDLLGM